MTFSVEVVGGGAASPEEVAALVAALEVLAAANHGDRQPSVSPWRWSGRRWGPPPGRRWR